jgi:tetratricopeptide (TPR) repeat protein
MQLINDLETKVKLNPDDYKSLLELAHLKNDSGLFDAAIQNYKTYLDKNPKDADARVDMGVCYFNLQDFPSAIKEMETALKYVPNHQIAHLNLGVVNLSAGNIEKSKEWLKKAYNLNPANEVGKKAEQLLNNH